MTNKVPSEDATLKQIVDFYLKSPDYKRLKANTQKDYANRLDVIVNTRVGHTKLGNFRIKQVKVRHLVQAYEHWLSTKGVRQANYCKSVFSAVWKHAMRYDIMSHNPISLVKTVSSKPRRVKWEREHIQAFLSTAYSDFRWRSIGLIVHMAYEWGQRVGDMRVLTWDKLDLEKCRMDLTQSKRNADVHLPISDNLCAMLRQQQEDLGFQEYVAPKVTTGYGVVSYKPYAINDVSNHINEILDEANLPKHLTAMDLRRTAVTEMMEGGADLVDIMQVTGHRSPNSVKPYMVNTFRGATKALALRGNNKEDDDE